MTDRLRTVFATASRVTPIIGHSNLDAHAANFPTSDGPLQRTLRFQQSGQ